MGWLVGMRLDNLHPSLLLTVLSLAITTDSTPPVASGTVTGTGSGGSLVLISIAVAVMLPPPSPACYSRVWPDAMPSLTALCSRASSGG